MGNMEYPIAFRHEVPPRRSILQTMNSRLRDIPNDRLDYAVVLDFAGVYELVPNGTPVSKAEGLSSAAAMVFVDIRPTILDVRMVLPCQGHIEQREVAVRFQSHVVAPEIVLEDRLEHLQARLEAWTRSLVAPISAGNGIEDHEQFLEIARSVINFQLAEQPPVSPAGIELRLIEVSSPLPTQLLEHQRLLVNKRRDTERRLYENRQDDLLSQETFRRAHKSRLQLAQLEEEAWRARQELADSEREKEAWLVAEEAARLEEAYRRGPEALLALMAARDPVALEGLVAHAVGDREFLANLLLQAAESGVVSSASVESLLTEAANDLLSGSGAQIGTAARTGELGRGARSSDTTGNDFDPDDDQFDDRAIKDTLSVEGPLTQMLLKADSRGSDGDTSENSMDSDQQSSKSGSAPDHDSTSTTSSGAAETDDKRS